MQGSFGLGTVTPPLNESDEYDIDAVCEFRRLTKLEKTQAELKRLLEVEMRSYARRQNMKKPLEEHRRCWRQPYADGAQFHIDVTPGIPSGGEASLTHSIIATTHHPKPRKPSKRLPGSSTSTWGNIGTLRER